MPPVKLRGHGDTAKASHLNIPKGCTVTTSPRSLITGETTLKVKDESESGLAVGRENLLVRLKYGEAYCPQDDRSATKSPSVTGGSQ
jgi:hypothetical protein